MAPTRSVVSTIKEAVWHVFLLYILPISRNTKIVYHRRKPFLLFLMLVESRSIATKFQTRLQTGNTFVMQLGAYTRQIQKQYRIQTMSNLLSAVAITVELLLFRVDFAVLWGFLAFILGFIPNVGLIIACLPAIMIAFILYGWGTALAVLAIGIALNAAMDNVV